MSLFDFISEMKLRQTTAKFPLARHDTCHVQESFKTRLRYVNMTYSDYFWFAWKKNSISNLHVIGMPLNEQSQFFSNAVLPSKNSRIPDETKKILRPKITPPPATKFPSPNFRAPKFFCEGLNDMARQKMESNCLWFVYSSYHLPNLPFLIWQSELRVQHCTRAVLHQFLSSSSTLLPLAPPLFVLVSVSLEIS